MQRYKDIYIDIPTAEMIGVYEGAHKNVHILRNATKADAVQWIRDNIGSCDDDGNINILMLGEPVPEPRMSLGQLVDICAKICYYAQGHSEDEDAWGPRNSSELFNMLQHTSFTVACFIAQNTEEGRDGVEWEVVQDKLIGPVLNLDAWREVIREVIDDYSN
jgi:hypothetical protein